MNELPAELRPWERDLSILPRDLALGFGPLVLHLARELGPLGARPLEDGGEPDGYDGLSRRGSYERLISTEWLYALELPEEFLRRATVGEQAFFHVRLREPAGARRSVALFDAGPAQLGTPRIAQLAALIALARRAEDAGAAFEWANLQEEGLCQGVTKSSVLRLLQGRSNREADRADLLRWRARVEAAREPDDLWIIGPERLADLEGTENASVLAVRDVIEPGTRKVAVEVRRPASSVRKAWTAAVSLQLPPPDDCVRLLRDPCRAAIAVPVAGLGPIDPAFGIHFAPHGNRLAVRLRNGPIVLQALPNSPRATAPPPRLIPQTEGLPVVAVGFSGARFVLPTVRGEALRVEIHGPRGGLSGQGEARLPSPPRPWPDAGAAPGTIYLDQRLLIDGAGSVFEEDSVQWTSLATGIASSALVAGRVHLIRAPGPPPGPGKFVVIDGVRRMRVAVREQIDRVAGFHGFDTNRGERSVLVAIKVAESIWIVVTEGGRQLDFHPPQGAEVVGVATHRGEPGLLLLEDGALTMAGKSFSHLLHLPGRVVTARASPYGPFVAAIGLAGQLRVWSLKHRAVILSFDSGRRLPGSGPATP